ncbi:MAG: biopolymer transporter ExbD [Deltaproteobacteria bacterium]|nr:biopolymer transporter ExbD [Deltaproteobacteria bacterium]
MRRSIRNRKSRRKVKKDFDLPLTSMMDMLIILLVFLLKSYSSSAIAFTTSNNIQLPNSMAMEAPPDAANLILEPTGLVLDGEKILEFLNPPASVPSPDGGLPIIRAADATYEIEKHQLRDGNRMITPLFDALVKAREKLQFVQSTQTFVNKDNQVTKPPKFNGTLIIHADKTIAYKVLRKVMYTAAAAEYKTFKLITVKKEESAADGVKKGT